MMDYLAETPVAEPSRFAMDELVAEIADSAKLEITYDGPAEVRLDRTMMSRILLNLARNAVHAGAKGGALKLTRSTADGSEFRLQLPMEMFASGEESAALANDRR